MALIDETISNLLAQGFFDYVLPFLLVFFVMFAILEQTKVFGEGKKGIHAAIAMVIALFMLYFARVFQVGRFLSYFTGKSFLTILILMFTMMITSFVFNIFKTQGMIKPKGEWKYAMAIFGGALLLMVIALNSSPSSWQMLFGAEGSFDPGVLLGIAGVIGGIGLIAIITAKNE